MQVIERMPDDEFDAVCAAGAELTRELTSLLVRLGLTLDNAPGVIAVASAGITKCFGVDPDRFGQMVAQAQNMWNVERDDRGGATVSFVQLPPAVEAAPEAGN